MRLLIIYMCAINCTAYFLMLYDKWQAKQKGSRIAENTLFFIAFILGAIGIYVGMKAPLYHKAAKQKFKIGIPILILLNMVIIASTLYFLNTINANIK